MTRKAPLSAGLHLWAVTAWKGEDKQYLWVTTARRDPGAAGRKAQALVTRHDSAFRHYKICKIEYEGTIEAYVYPRSARSADLEVANLRVTAYRGGRHTGSSILALRRVD